MNRCNTPDHAPMGTDADLPDLPYGDGGSVG